jgi:1,4-dihydroxy-2-naphthoate octaprenyltransferase
LIIGAYISTILMVIFKLIPLWSLLVFLTIPPAINNIRKLKNNRMENIEGIAILDVQSAQVHLLFGLVLSISIFLGKVL